MKPLDALTMVSEKAKATLMIGLLFGIAAMHVHGFFFWGLFIISALWLTRALAEEIIARAHPRIRQ